MERGEIENMYKEKDEELIRKLKSIKVANGSTPNEVAIAEKKLKALVKKEDKTSWGLTSKIKSTVKNELSTIVKDQCIDATDTFAKIQSNLKTETHSKQDTKKHLVCPVCGNDLFYGGACGGMSQNILCSECYTEFNYSICSLQQHTRDSVDLSRLIRQYIGSKKKAKQNPKAYKIVWQNTPWYQKIYWTFHR